MLKKTLVEKTDNYINNQESILIKKTAAKTQLILNEIVEFIQPGISESSAIQFAKEIFVKHKIDRIWHQPLIRFGENTIFTFKEQTTKDIILQENDIAFVDIGVVINGIEGDAGKTIVFGKDKLFNDLKVNSEHIFNIAQKFWLSSNPTGKELYDFIYSQAEQAGYNFNLHPAGHLIGSFSHAASGWSHGLSQYPNSIISDRWILEIQLQHKTAPYGAFFESLLIK